MSRLPPRLLAGRSPLGSYFFALSRALSPLLFDFSKRARTVETVEDFSLLEELLECFLPVVYDCGSLFDVLWLSIVEDLLVDLEIPIHIA